MKMTQSLIVNQVKPVLRKSIAALGVALVLSPFSFAHAGEEAPPSEKVVERSVQGARVGEINPAEKEKYKTRFEAKNSSVFGFGPSFGAALNTDGMLYGFTYGYEWEVGSNGAVTAHLGGYFGGGASYIDGIIGAKYFFSDADISPFVQGGLGMAAAKGNEIDSCGGFAGEAGLGLVMFRTSTVHLEVLASYRTVFARNDKGTPGVGNLALQILY